MSRLIVFMLLSAVLGIGYSHEVHLPKSKKKQTQLGLYYTAKQAYDVLKKHGKNTLFIDVRTRAEVNFLGLPTNVDANIPYMKMTDWYDWDKKKNQFRLEPNSQFESVLRRRLKEKNLGKQDRIILLCRSGSRSAKAADLLKKHGYTRVYTIIDGYEGDKAKSGKNKGQRVVNGWRNSGLPWTYKLDRKKMYLVKN